MPFEEWLVDGDVFQRLDAFALVNLKNPVDQQKWIAMRQFVENLVNIHHAWSNLVSISLQWLPGHECDLANRVTA